MSVEKATRGWYTKKVYLCLTFWFADRTEKLCEAIAADDKAMNIAGNNMTLDEGFNSCNMAWDRCANKDSSTKINQINT